MGADGHIRIWRSDEVRAEHPDADELFACIPTHYQDELDGVKYDHVYWGDNMGVHWADEAYWYMPHYPKWEGSKMLPLPSDEQAENDALKVRLRAFVLWLESHGTHWEVWT